MNSFIICTFLYMYRAACIPDYLKSLYQLLMYNCVERRSSQASKTLHRLERGTPLPLMLAMKIHMKTGQRNLIDSLAQRGLCSPYSRMSQVSCQLANAAITFWEKEGVVVPPHASKNVFTTGGMDNIDYNPTSTTAKTVLHGTGISIIQHHSLPYSATPLRENLLNESLMNNSNVLPLPAFYSTMEDVTLTNAELSLIPQANLSNPLFWSRSISDIIQPGLLWLERVHSFMDKGLMSADNISWGAYHAAQADPPQFISKSFMLPIFTEKADCPTTLYHAMKVIRDATQYLNPGQTPVMVGDQPLFTLAKRLQWKLKDTFISEDKFVVMMGPLHVEKSCGLSQATGWTVVDGQLQSPTAGYAPVELRNRLPVCHI